jgi:predicted kinase
MRVLAAVAHHHDPKLLIVRDRPMSAFKMLSWRARPEDLWALELADMRGRTCPDRDEQVELIELYRLGCEEAGCWGDPERGWGGFVAGVREGMSGVEDVDEVERAVLEGVWALGAGEIYTPEEAVARSYEGRGERARVTLMYGPSGSGKSTWARERAAEQGAELIRLDALRAQIRGKEGDQRANGQVIQMAREQLKACLRAGRPVVWDATSLRREHRAAVLETARRYGAHTTLAVMHVGWSVAAERNRARAESVPEAALARQRQGVQYPEVDEAHRVLWLGHEGEVLADTRERWMEMGR